MADPSLPSVPSRRSRSPRTPIGTPTGTPMNSPQRSPQRSPVSQRTPPRRNVRARRNLEDTSLVQLNVADTTPRPPLTPKQLQSLTLRQCRIFYERKVNPFTNEQLTITSNEFGQLKEACVPNFLRALEKWKQNPFVDPFDDSIIILWEDNIYFKTNKYQYLYRLFFTFFLENQVEGRYFSVYEIMQMLPKNHQLFNNQIDLLAFQVYPQSIPRDQHAMYKHMVNFIGILNNKDKIEGYESLNNAESTVLYTYALLYCEGFAHLMNYIDKILTKDEMKNYHTHLLKIMICMHNIKLVTKFTQNYNLLEPVKMAIQKYNYLIMEELLNNIGANVSGVMIDAFYTDIFQSTNFLETTEKQYQSIYHIYNYKADPRHSPFVNLENVKKIEPIEDPLLKILNDIGVQELDLQNLSIPERLFKNDEEYTKYKDEYTKLKNKYVTEMKQWSDYEDKKSVSSPVPKPERPKLLLPNGIQLDVTSQILPKHITDDEYNKKKDFLDKNQHIIDLYKSYLNKDLIDILSKAKITIDKNNIAQIKLAKKDREYFVKNVLYDGSDNKDKCNNNTDGIDYTDFDDNYMLSRLQLMFQLKTNYQDKNKTFQRIDCFYAPNFYNHVVEKINEKMPVTNPVNNIIIPSDQLENAIDDLMKIMNVIDASIPRPRYIMPPRDTKLFIEATSIDAPWGQEFLRLRICRDFDGVIEPVVHLCFIPNDIEPAESGSTDINSAVFASTLKSIFDKGTLLHNYLPPYYATPGNYIKPLIHFNMYNNLEKHWHKSRAEQLKIFKHYLEELKARLVE